MLFAYSGDPGLGAFGGFVLGAFLIGFVWLIVAAARWDVDQKHELYHNGYLYSTKKANRVVGVVGERISEGKWIAVIKSLWRTYPDFRGEHRFFILRNDELNPPKIYPLTADKAKDFVKGLVDTEMAGKLIRDWFGEEPPSTSAAVVHHEHH